MQESTDRAPEATPPTRDRASNEPKRPPSIVDRADGVLRDHPLIAMSAAVTLGAVLGAASRRIPGHPLRHLPRLGSSLISVLSAAALRHGVKTAINRFTDGNRAAAPRSAS